MHRFTLAGVAPAILTTLLAVPTGAQPSPVVHEADFLAALTEVHPALLERAEALGVARARVVAASTFENPTLNAGQEDPSGPDRETAWTVSWQLPHRGRRSRIQAREMAVQAATAGWAHDLVLARVAMRGIYADWAVAHERRSRLQGQIDRLDALAARQSARAERGEASGLSAHRLGLAASLLRARMAFADAEVHRAEAEARIWVPELPENAEPVLPPLPRSGELGLDKGGEEPPALLAARADLQAASLERKAAGYVLLSPEISLGWKTVDLGPRSIDGPVVGLSWSVPLFDRKGAERALADARVTAAGARLETVRREIHSGRRAAVDAYRVFLESLAEARGVLADSERMLTGAEEAFLQGEASLTDLLEMLSAARDAELSWLEVHAAALAAHRDWERLSGTAEPTPVAGSSGPPSHVAPEETTP